LCVVARSIENTRGRFRHCGQFANERRAVNATERERVVSLNAITLGAAFHLECGGLTPLL
jgi:hypothetical protein